jgi:replicative DNA helicase
MSASDTVRLPPHNVEAEESTLASVLIDPGVIDRLPFLHAEHFFIVKNGWLWAAFCALHERREPIDFLMACNEMEARGQLTEIGGP